MRSKLIIKDNSSEKKSPSELICLQTSPADVDDTHKTQSPTSNFYGTPDNSSAKNSPSELTHLQTSPADVDDTHKTQIPTSTFYGIPVCLWKNSKNSTNGQVYPESPKKRRFDEYDEELDQGKIRKHKKPEDQHGYRLNPFKRYAELKKKQKEHADDNRSATKQLKRKFFSSSMRHHIKNSHWDPSYAESVLNSE